MTSTTNASDVVVLTGSMGSGKSTAAAMLRDLGAAVVSADELAREVVRPGSDALEEIRREFGDEVLGPDGALDRKKLAAVVFPNPAKRARLEAITHPRIRVLGEARFASERASGSPLIVYDCPLFFEAGLDRSEYRAVIVVHADEKSSIERVMKRDGMSENDAKLRLSQQFPIVEKAAQADYVLDNSGTIDELRGRVREVFETLTR